MLKMATKQKVHLCLAHLVEEDPNYANFYKNLDDSHKIILDNSAFEMFKRNKPMYESSKLIEMGKKIGADVIVLSDYPGEHISKTISAAETLIPEFKKNGFGTFFVPQSEVGKSDQLFEGFEYAIGNSDIDLIGISILGCPNAYGVERGNKLQRFLSRKHVFDQLKRRNLLTNQALNRFHCLGMTDGPNEIELLKDYHNYIFSWDSSAAVWAGAWGIEFDDSPTGLIDGKFEKEVDFGHIFDVTKEKSVNFNVDYINNLCK